MPVEEVGLGAHAASKDTRLEAVVKVASRVMALDGSVIRDKARSVAVEIPVEVSFADAPFAVMMLTPADLTDFAYGFSLTEGIIERRDQIRDVVVSEIDGGLSLRIALTGDRLHKHLARQRAMTGRTGCGICGIDDIEALQRATLRRGVPRTVEVGTIARALSELEGRQALNKATRAVHGAAWADLSGHIKEVREDVGRHNALDKLLGALLQAQVDPREGFVVITSRCSFEMVEKAATFGTSVIVAISAPTSFAITRAEALGLTLVAIARRDTLTIFTNVDRILTLRK